MEDPKPLESALLEKAFDGDPEALGAIQRWIYEIIERKGVNLRAFNEAARMPVYSEAQQGRGPLTQEEAEAVNAGLDPLPPKE